MSPGTPRASCDCGGASVVAYDFEVGGRDSTTTSGYAAERTVRLALCAPCLSRSFLAEMRIAAIAALVGLTMPLLLHALGLLTVEGLVENASRQDALPLVSLASGIYVLFVRFGLPIGLALAALIWWRATKRLRRFDPREAAGQALSLGYKRLDLTEHEGIARVQVAGCD